MGGKYATLMRFWLARKRRAGAAARLSSFAIDGVPSPPAAPIVVHRLRVARARELFDRGRRPLCGCRRRARSACRRRLPPVRRWSAARGARDPRRELAERLALPYGEIRPALRERGLCRLQRRLPARSRVSLPGPARRRARGVRVAARSRARARGGPGPDR